MKHEIRLTSVLRISTRDKNSVLGNKISGMENKVAVFDTDNFYHDSLASKNAL